MDLKNTINNTNTQKENIKTVATQIDNKLVELGGEQATDLADVPNKMEVMVKTQYKRVAQGSCNVNLNTIYLEPTKKIEVSIPLKFTPKKFFMGVKPIKNDSTYDDFTHFIQVPFTNKGMGAINGGGFFNINSAKFNSDTKQLILNTQNRCESKMVEWIAIE